MPKLKVLIVDDEVFFRSIVSDWVRLFGYIATPVASGAEAIKAIKSDKFDIVILDYMMPVMDGVAALKKIREIDHDVAVVMFTGRPSDESISGSEKLGISAYITKLSMYSDVQDSLKSVCGMIEKKLNKAGGDI